MLVLGDFNHSNGDFLPTLTFIMSDKENIASTVIANEGLWQRLNLLFMYIPLCIVCLQEIRNIFHLLF